MGALRPVLRRLPIRLRVTAAFTVAMAAVLAALGLAVHARFAGDLDASIDRGLRSRAGDVARIATSSDQRLLVARSDGVAQLFDGIDAVGTPAAGGAVPLLDRAGLLAARRGELLREVPAPDDDERLRLLAVPAGPGAVAVVGASLEERDDALEFLRGLLLLRLPAALVLAGLAWRRSCGVACERTGSSSTSPGAARTPCGWPARRTTTSWCST